MENHMDFWEAINFYSIHPGYLKCGIVSVLFKTERKDIRNILQME